MEENKIRTIKDSLWLLLIMILFGLIAFFIDYRSKMQQNQQNRFKDYHPTTQKNNMGMSKKVTFVNDSVFNTTRNKVINYYTVLVYLIKSNEGYANSIYKCPAGVPTIGWGFTKAELESLNKEFNTKLTWEEILNGDHEEILKKVIESRFNKLRLKYNYLDAPTIYSLLSFTFNLGSDVLNNRSISNGLKAILRTGNKTILANAMLKYTKAHTKKGFVELEGLKTRRGVEVKLLLEDISPKDIKILQEMTIKKKRNPIN